MAGYRLTPRAERDLEDIWRYTAERWSAAQADIYVGGLIDAMEHLAREPERGRAAEDVRPGYLKYGSGSHILFYKRARAGITVVRVLHRRMDNRRHFDPA